MATRSQLRNQIQRSARTAIGGHNVLDTVRERAAISTLPNALAFGLAVLSREGRIADPSAFANGWRSATGDEKSPWQIDPNWHLFARNTPVSNFRAYTDYAYSLLEKEWFDAGSLFHAARRYNSFNACEQGRSEACQKGRSYASEVMDRMNKIQPLLSEMGIGTPNVSTFPVPGGRPDVGGPTVGGPQTSGPGWTTTLVVGGIAAGVGLLIYSNADEERLRRPIRR